MSRSNGDRFEVHVTNAFAAEEYQVYRKYVLPNGKKPDLKVMGLFGQDYGYVECRWQSSSGSAHEKTDGLVRKILEFYDRDTMIVFGGSARETEAAYRIAKESEGRGNLRCVIHGLDGLIHWLSGGDSAPVRLEVTRPLFDGFAPVLERVKRKDHTQ